MNDAKKNPIFTGGMGCGFIIDIPDHGLKIYHAGNTNLFSDMRVICDLYKPDVVCLPMDGVDGMGVDEAVYAAKNFLTNVKKIIPMGFRDKKTSGMNGLIFAQKCKEEGVAAEICTNSKFLGGAALLE